MLAIAVLIAALAVWWLRDQPASTPSPATAPGGRATAPAPGPSAPVPTSSAACAGPPAFAAAAAANASSLRSLAWEPFGKAETGWEIYAPLIAHEIGSRCGPAQAGFAAALARWQRTRGLAADGRVSAPTFEVMRVLWHRRRPFVAQAAAGCPPGAAESTLVLAEPQESYGGKQIGLRSDAMAAYRRMIAAARAERPEVFAGPAALTLFSGYRNPVVDSARCALGSDCDGRARSNCSAHRTGLAVDLYLGAAPGFKPESSADENRLYQTRTPAYLWLVDNAARFGFAPYAFEPWHWEWTGGA